MINSYEASFDVSKEDVSRIFKEIFGDKEQQDRMQKQFIEAAIKDVISYFNSISNHDDSLPKEIQNFLKSIAVLMYMRGFNRSFEYYIKHEDIFNLEGNEDTK